MLLTFGISTTEGK